MKVEIDERSGFCFGVVRAISLAEEALRVHGSVYSLGDIVHNRVEVQRLERLGLKVVSDCVASPLFIRAHGEPPSTYKKARELGIEIIDATCPVVAQLQRKVVEAHRQMEPVGGQVVLLGKRGHAEVVGLTGQVERETIVIEGEKDLSLIDFSKPIYFLSQTTQSIGLFEKLAEAMELKMENGKLKIEKTICGQVSGREAALEKFARTHDVVVFVSGRKSSNGRVLFDVCRAANPRSYLIEEPSELRAEWFDETNGETVRSVGICGATSTPKWLMEQTQSAIENQKYA